MLLRDPTHVRATTIVASQGSRASQVVHSQNLPQNQANKSVIDSTGSKSATSVYNNYSKSQSVPAMGRGDPTLSPPFSFAPFPIIQCAHIFSHHSGLVAAGAVAIGAAVSFASSRVVSTEGFPDESELIKDVWYPVGTSVERKGSSGACSWSGGAREEARGN